MDIAIITDSTCDLPPAESEALGVRVVPLYISFRGETFRDWVEISTAEVVAGVGAGADLPTTSQPSPQDFEEAYREAAAAGAREVLCLSISSDLSGTFASANLARQSAPVPVTIFDSRTASVGLGEMVKQAAELRDAGEPVPEIVRALEHLRDNTVPLFTVATLDYLQKGGRIGRASALLGSLLNVKPLLSVEDGRIVPLGRARGNKRALKDMVDRVLAFRDSHSGELVMSFLHVRDHEAAETLRDAVRAAGVTFRDRGIYEVGAVISAHVGPGTYGLFMHEALPAGR